MPKKEKHPIKVAEEIIGKRNEVLKKLNRGKKIEGGPRKVSRKKAARKKYKWLKQIYAEIDELKDRLTRLEERVSEMSVIMACGFAEGEERLKLIEWFLGGREAMKKVKEENERSEHKEAKHS